MRRLLILSAATAVLFVLAGCTIQYYEDPNAYQDEYEETYYEDDYYESDTGVVFDEFEDLQFWGQWIDLYPYGWVWSPSVVMGWRPYENGHWIWSEYGWTWASYEPFGWATYHYGFWAYDVVWGWVWIPDYEWSAARVDWIIYDDYIAWAPLPPPGFRIGEPWNVTEVYVWHVVPAGDFVRPDIGRYHVGYKQNYRVRNRSTVKYKAPHLDYVEGRTNVVVRPVKVELTDRLTRGERTIKGIRLPDTELKRIDRYRDRTEQKIRDTDPPREREIRDTKPVQDDRILPPKREKRREPERRKEPATKPPAKKKPATERPATERPATERPAKKKQADTKPRKQEPDTPKARKPDAPIKQEPKKEPTKDTGKRKPTRKKKG